MILSYTLILPMSQLQTQQLMTSLIRSHIEYLLHTNNILVLILYSKLMRNVAALAIFNTILWWFLILAYFFGPPYIYEQMAKFYSLLTIRGVTFTSFCI